MTSTSLANVAVAGLLASLTRLAAAQSSIVNGTPLGFAYGVTGGGTAETVYIAPGDLDTLKTYLESDDPQNIVISGTFDFTGSEGSTTYEACYPYSCTPSEGGQGLLNTLSGCGSNALSSVTVDTAGVEGINVQSDKTLVGMGSTTILKGKGLRFAGVSNIIIQNLEITDINPEYVWGGDALVFSDTSYIWIDHVTTSSLGRQHYSFGQDPDQYITISNSYLNGQTSYSATCDGHTYWGIELVGTDDTITFYNNYVTYTSGRTPALSGTTLFHAVNNVFEHNTGHMIEGTSEGMGLYEGNYIYDVPTPVASGSVVDLYTAESADLAQCAAYLGRNCVVNEVVDSGSFNYDTTSFFSQFSGKHIVSATAAASAATYVPANAGNTLPW